MSARIVLFSLSLLVACGGKEYDAFKAETGPSCGTEWRCDDTGCAHVVVNRCFPGDRCLDEKAGTCECVLTCD